MPKDDKVVFTAIEIGPCPFCDGELSATVDADAVPDGITHTMPFCKKFEELSADDFIHEAANEAAAQLGKNN